jgi:hypothetical protein
MPRNASEGLKLRKGREKLLIFVLKTLDKDAKFINHLRRAVGGETLATLSS